MCPVSLALKQFDLSLDILELQMFDGGGDIKQTVQESVPLKEKRIYAVLWYHAKYGTTMHFV